MFQNRYWRSYPGWLQILLFVMMSFSLVSFCRVIAFLLIPKITNAPLDAILKLTENATRAAIDAHLMLQALMSAGLFLIPALLFAYFTHPKPGKYLGLRKPGKAIHWLLVPVAMVSLMPILLSLEALFREINWGPAIMKQQEQTDKLMKALLSFTSFGDFIKAFAVLALLPAVGEELFFRGIVMRMVHWRVKKITHVIVISSFIFALMHTNPMGLVSILMAGGLLGAIYYFTGSLWLSMLAHLINNGLQITLLYMARSNAAVKAVIESNQLPVYYSIIGAVLFTISIYLLWKNRTPLPYDWSDDYAGEDGTELS